MSIDHLKYCALCLQPASKVWTISVAGDSALVPLCTEHEPQVERLFRLCRDSTPAGPGTKRRRSRPRPLEFTPLTDWQPPTES